jgi:hypothetical protein
MQPTHRLDDPGALGVGADPGLLASVEAQARRDRLERATGVEVDIDPSQLLRPDVVEIVLARVESAVPAVGVEEPCADAAVQWTNASNSAAMAATIAIPYWVACMDRSAGASATSSGRSTAGVSTTIDRFLLGLMRRRRRG